MGVPDDANPLNRRLPAEVVSRRRKVEKVEKEETPLATDRGQVLAMKPEHRLKWVSKAVQKCHEGRIPVNTVFDIVTHAKFTSDCSDKIGSKMYRALRANLGLFSSKQQRYLQEECRLVQLFKGTLRGAGAGGETAEPAGAEAAGSSGDVDATAEAPTDSAGIAALWARMTQLSPEERADAVEQLDASTKELLEGFLEARIKRAQGSGSADGPDQEDGGAGADAAQAAQLPQGSRSRSRSRRPNSRDGSRDGSRGRDGRRRSRSRSRSRGAEKGRRARERSRSRSRSEASKRGREAKGGKRNRDRDDGSRRGKKGKGRRGRSSSGSPS